MTGLYTATDHFVVMPGLLLALFGCSILLFDLMVRSRKQRRWLLGLSLVGTVFVLASLFRQHQYLDDHQLTELQAFGGSLVLDRLTLFFNWIFAASCAVVTLMAYRFVEESEEPAGEFYGLLFLAQSGMFFLASGTDLITLFVGLELMAVCFYILVGYSRSDKRSNEAALKYLLLGAFSSGFLLYGFSLLYGLSGSTRLKDIAVALAGRGLGDPITFMAVAATSVGLLFKVAAAPFHMWAPDAYQGSPTPVTAYLSVGSKAAAFALLIRLYRGPLGDVRDLWEPILTMAAVASLTLGNLAALSQTNVKRLLAYSSIAHAGFILLGLIAGNQTGLQGITVYLLVYTVMTLGAFIVITLSGDALDDLDGLAVRHPGYAAWMVIFMLSLGGIPPTAGFLGKYFIFLALIETGHHVLAVLAVLYSAVSLYYYFRIIRSMFNGAWPGTRVLANSVGLRVSLAAMGLFTLGIGLYPEPFLQFARVTGLDR